MNTTREHSSVTGIVGGAWLVGVGGLLLGLQIDWNGSVSGTGWVSFAIGALLAVGATLVRLRGDAARHHDEREPRAGVADVSLPRDVPGILAVVTSFLALTFLISGVLVPGGPWLFFEIVVLGAVIVARRQRAEGGRWLSNGMLTLLAAMLLFRLWIAYQGGRNHWSLLSVDIPVISWLPFDFLEPVKRVSLGSFTPDEFGFPPAGLSFAPTLALWAVGFVSCVAGLVWAQTSAREHENDRIHALIRTLPGGLANFVERILPEDEWQSLGLHGLPERRLARRIETIVAERMARQKELQAALDAGKLLAQTNPGGFAGEIYRSIVDPERRVGADADGGTRGSRNDAADDRRSRDDDGSPRGGTHS